MAAAILLLSPSVLPVSDYQALINEYVANNGDLGYSVTSLPCPEHLVDDSNDADSNAYWNSELTYWSIVSNGATVDDRLSSLAHACLPIPLTDGDTVSVPVTLFITLIGWKPDSDVTVIATKELSTAGLQFMGMPSVPSDILGTVDNACYNGEDITFELSTELSASLITNSDIEDYNQEVTINNDVISGTLFSDYNPASPSPIKTSNPAPSTLPLYLYYVLHGYDGIVSPLISLVDINENGIKSYYLNAIEGNISYDENSSDKSGIIECHLACDFSTEPPSFTSYDAPGNFDGHSIAIRFDFFCPGVGIIRKEYSLDLAYGYQPSENDSGEQEK